MAQFDIVPGLTFVTRSSWGADAELPRLGQRVARGIRTHVFAHHTVIIDNDTTPNIWESENEVFAMMRRLQTTRPDLGLDVPYNFVVFLTAMNNGLYVCEGRGEDRTGAHTKGHNTRAIATSFAGDFENRVIDPAEIANRLDLYSNFLGWLKYSASHPQYGDFEPLANLGKLKPAGRSIFFHKDVKATDCPGSKLESHLRRAAFTWP
jgi:hypothetical protein